MLFGGILCRYMTAGWVYIFLFTSLFGFLWLPLWLWLSADSPLTHRTISEKERKYIVDELKLDVNEKKKSIPLSALPWKKIVQSKAIIGLFVTECCNLFGLFFFYTNVGKILTEIHHIPTQYAGYVLAGGFILMPVSCVLSGKSEIACLEMVFRFLMIGVIADRLVRSKVSLTIIRKVFNSIASFIPAICMVVLCFCDESWQILGVVTILILLVTSGTYHNYFSLINPTI